jgi:hypothetical protein
MSKTIKYTPGETHAIRLDDNTVALVVPVEYAATVRDILWSCVAGSARASRRKWTRLMAEALNRLTDFPALTQEDISREYPGIVFADNARVK